MSVYSELWELLRPPPPREEGVVTGRLSALSPLSFTVGETVLDRGFVLPAGMRFYREDLGREAALLPCGEGFLFLFFTEGRSAS